MRTSLRMLAVGAVLAAAPVLTACGQGEVSAARDDGDRDYRAMQPKQVCQLLTAEEAAQIMKPLTTDRLTPSGEQHNSLPACNYGAGDGAKYLMLSIHQSSALGEDDDAEKVSVAGKQALQMRPFTGCSVAIPLEKQLYLLAIVESWESGDEESCTAATEALAKAYPRLTG